MKTDGAAWVAVKLALHESAGWDGGFAQGARQAVVGLGALAVPHLEKVKAGENESSKKIASELLDRIGQEEGK